MPFIFRHQHSERGTRSCGRNFGGSSSQWSEGEGDLTGWKIFWCFGLVRKSIIHAITIILWIITHQWFQCNLKLKIKIDRLKTYDNEIKAKSFKTYYFECSMSAYSRKTWYDIDTRLILSFCSLILIILIRLLNFFWRCISFSKILTNHLNSYFNNPWNKTILLKKIRKKWFSYSPK